MNKLHLLFFIFITPSCNRLGYENRLREQGEIKCGWYGKKTIAECRKTYPFNEATKIVLISYPNYENEGIYSTKDSVVTPWGERLKNSEIMLKPIKTASKAIIDTIKFQNRLYSIYEKIELDTNQIDSLSFILMNYKTNINLKNAYSSQGCCYRPRNSIIFYNKFNKPFLNFELCFDCPENKVYSDKYHEFISYNCTNKYELIKDYFRKKGINYGIDSFRGN